MEERKEKVIKLVRLKPSDLINWDQLYSMRMNWDVYHFLANLIFFNNQYCEDNIVDLEKNYWNFDLEDKNLSKRANKVCEIAKIETFQDLVNFPSIEIIKIRMCGSRTIQEFKAYIIKVVRLFNHVRIPGLPEAKTTRIIDLKRYIEFKKKQKQDLDNWFKK